MRTVSRSEVPDLPDRIIAATAVHLGVPAISRDGKIRTSSVDTIW
jgi:PIN domain nuclease of toxin-antitoxin system